MMPYRATITSNKQAAHGCEPQLAAQLYKRCLWCHVKPSKPGQTHPGFGLCTYDCYKSVHVASVHATLVNTQTRTKTAFDPLYQKCGLLVSSSSWTNKKLRQMDGRIACCSVMWDFSLPLAVAPGSSSTNPVVHFRTKTIQVNSFISQKTSNGHTIWCTRKWLLIKKYKCNLHGDFSWNKIVVQTVLLSN